VLLALSLPALGQEIQSLKALDALESKASERVNVTLDANLLQMASKFLGKDDPDEAKVKKLVHKLRGVYVRGFEFDHDNAYSMADVEAIRKELKTPEWSRIVDVFSKKDGENAEVYIHRTRGQVTGLAVLALAPRELTVVNIVGDINLEELTELGGEFGIPPVEKKKQPPPPKKDD
jgi:hypothetical protein